MFLQRLWNYPGWTVGTKLIVLTVPLIAVLSGSAALLEHKRVAADLQEKLSTRAQSLAYQIMADRQYYASVIVPRAQELGASFGADYAGVHGRFPLPATFVREVSERTGREQQHYTAKLISPWPINKAQGVSDEFQREGFEFLRQHPQQPFVRSDSIQERPVLRALLADRASAHSCVGCHNSHPDSPKHDFALNDVMGGLEITMPLDQYLKESRRDLTFTLAGGTGMCILVFAIVAFGSRRVVTQPLRDLAGKMQAFAGSAHAGAGMPVRDETVHLSLVFERMRTVITRQQEELQQANQFLEQRVIERTEELRVSMAEKERIASELRIASDIQKSILPRTFPPFPEREDFEIYATTIPALEMGGDFYDFFLIDQHQLGVVIADVSGKGVPAAIFMAVSRSLLKATAFKHASPSECLQHVNQLLCPDNDSAMFVTVFYGIFDTRTGLLTYSNAGHNVPYVVTEGHPVPLDQAKGVALGILDDAVYTTSKVLLHAGESLVLYTDGVTEAMDPHGRMFSTPRLEHTLHRFRKQRPMDLVRNLIGEVNQYAGGAVQADDVTLLVLQDRR